MTSSQQKGKKAWEELATLSQEHKDVLEDEALWEFANVVKDSQVPAVEQVRDELMKRVADEMISEIGDLPDGLRSPSANNY